mmetsp:Transcript_45086/g.89344  ORF Transcript_45086/g.89344 Transcript_45086/m.89344 type:complete len:134 (+) Transcript_45086:322-723(+)
MTNGSGRRCWEGRLDSDCFHFDVVVPDVQSFFNKAVKACLRDAVKAWTAVADMDLCPWFAGCETDRPICGLIDDVHTYFSKAIVTPLKRVRLFNANNRPLWKHAATACFANGSSDKERAYTDAPLENVDEMEF